MDPRELRRQAIRNECVARNITITQKGQAYRLTGPGVDVMVVDIANLDLKDVQAFVAQNEKQSA